MSAFFCRTSHRFSDGNLFVSALRLLALFCIVLVFLRAFGPKIFGRKTYVSGFFAIEHFVNGIVVVRLCQMEFNFQSPVSLNLVSIVLVS